MRKLLRRTLIAVTALVAAAVVLSVVGVAMFKGTPTWYRRAAADRPTTAQREQLARAAENKMIEAQNWAATLRADAERGRRAANASSTTNLSSRDATRRASSAAPRAESSHVIEFTDGELNALFDKW